MKKYNITTRRGRFFFNGKDCTKEWFNHFSGLNYEQEKRCTKLFIPYYLRRYPEMRLTDK